MTTANRPLRVSPSTGADVRARVLLVLTIALFAGLARGESTGKWKTPAGTLYFGNRPPAGSTLIEGQEGEESTHAIAPVGTERVRGRLSASASEHVGEVVGIADGDTFTLLVGREQLKIRLAEIDTPEGGQPYGNRARQALSDLIYRKTARVVVVDHDRYGRVVGRVYVGGLDVNAEMVRGGVAWVYRRYARDQSLYQLEDEARRARRGIWALPETAQEPPWRWREERREEPSLSTTAPAVPQGPVIGNRRSFIYHRPDCPDYGKVSPKNRVYFDSQAAAETAGFREARNCP